MTLREIASSAASFDAVMMVGVLEHLVDLDGALAHVRTLVSPGGRLFVEVPDATAFADWPNAPYQDFSTEHLNFFSPTSLTNLMRRHGFSRVFAGAEPSRTELPDGDVQHLGSLPHASRVRRRHRDPFDTGTAPGLERYLAQSAAEERAAARGDRRRRRRAAADCRVGRRHAHQPPDGDQPSG